MVSTDWLLIAELLYCILIAVQKNIIAAVYCVCEMVAFHQDIGALLIYLHAVATIGFENVTISVSEGAMFAEIPVAVLGATTLGGEVTVNFSTLDLTAIG